jgi:hypothetical protein
MTNTSGGASKSTTQPVILNACLAYMRFNMVSRDKLYIQDATCARFDLQSLKAAHEVITEFCGGGSKYRGPQNSSQRERIVHCFEEIYRILANLDAQRLTPSIACPSEDLHKLLEMNGHWDHKVTEDRFQKIEGDVSYIKGMESSLADLKRTVLAMMTNKSLPGDIGLPLAVKERVLSESTSQVSHLEKKLITKSRSESVTSNKRFRQEEEEEEELSDSDLQFLQPKYNLRKAEKRQKRSPDNKTFNKVSSASTAPISTPQRRKANWGKAVNTSSSGLVGAIPDLFVFNCAENPDESAVKAYLVARGITVVSVQMKSPPDAYKKSFKVSVASQGDYDILLAGEILPVGAGVKRFVHPRRLQARQSWSSMNHPPVITSSTANGQTGNINEFMTLSESESSSLIRGNSGAGNNTSAATVSKDINIEGTNLSSVCKND